MCAFLTNIYYLNVSQRKINHDKVKNNLNIFMVHDKVN